MPRLIVRFQPEAKSADIIRRRKRHGGSQVARRDRPGRRPWRLVEVEDAERALADYAADPLVESVSIEQGAAYGVVPDDPWFPVDVYHPNYLDGTVAQQGQYVMGASNRLNMPAAWDITTGSSDVRIAVLDSGCYAAHEDFGSRLVSLSGNNFNVLDGEGNPTTTTDDVVGTDGHGTGICGLLAADSNNTLGIAAMDWACDVIYARIGDSTIVYEWDATQGIDWAVANGADIICTSFGYTYFSLMMEEAINDAIAAGVIVVAIAHNHGNDKPIYPAAYRGVLCVGGLEQDDTFASFSCYGPSQDIVTYARHTRMTSKNNYIWGRYYRGTGTSFASPLVAGALSLVKAAYPTLTPREVVAKVLDGATGTTWSQTLGWGRLRPVAALASGSVSAPPEAPTGVGLEVGESGNTLTWNAVTGTNIVYRIYRNVPDHRVTFADVYLDSPRAIIGATTLLTFTDSDIVEGETYGYTIEAVAAYGSSGLSEAVYLPVYPPTFVLSTFDGTAITTTWEGSGTFEIRRTVDGGEWSETVFATSPYVDDDLGAWGTAEYEVRTVVGGSVSEWVSGGVVEVPYSLTFALYSVAEAFSGTGTLQLDAEGSFTAMDVWPLRGEGVIHLYGEGAFVANNLMAGVGEIALSGSGRFGGPQSYVQPLRGRMSVAPGIRGRMRGE